MTHALLLALPLATLLLGGCDPKAGSAAIGTDPSGVPTHELTTAFGDAIPARPMPDSGGVMPTLPPPINPLLDPADGTKTWGLDGPANPVPWKLTNPAAKAGCKCRLVCGPVNDDGSKDCITMCEGSDC